MGESKRRKKFDVNYGKSNHPKVTRWIQRYLPMEAAVYRNESNALTVFKVPCAIPTNDSEISRDDRVTFKHNLESYQADERIVCYLNHDNEHHLYLINDFEGDVDDIDERDFSEIGFNWSLFLYHIQIHGEGYYRIDHKRQKAQPLGKNWEEACASLKSIGHVLVLAKSNV